MEQQELTDDSGEPLGLPRARGDRPRQHCDLLPPG